MKHELAEEVKIYKTTDYDRFTFIKGNRVVSRGHVNRLKKSVQKRNLLHKNPILVMVTEDNKLGVIDGQHRLVVCQELGLPVYYDIGNELTLDDVKLLNVTVKMWSLKDSMHRYIELGDENYMTLKKYVSEYKVGFTNAIAILASEPTLEKEFNASYEAFKDGNFEIINYDEKLNFTQSITGFKQYISTERVWSHRLFMRALWRLYYGGEVDMNLLLQKYRETGTAVIGYAGTEVEYLRQLEDVYNRDKRQRVRFY